MHSVLYVATNVTVLYKYFYEVDIKELFYMF